MTRAATMGTSSCATIAIAHFKGNNKADNEAYKANGTVPETSGLSVGQFYNEIILPTSQPLGHTRELPFQKLMDDIDSSGLETKYISATLNASQRNEDDRYWEKELLGRGFRLSDITNNTLGQTCYIYTRNNNRVENADATIAEVNAAIS